MRSAVIVFPGSNREGDVADAIERVSGRRPALVWHRDADIPDSDLIVLPGGFSYGDYLRTGAIAARSPAMREVARRAGRGVPVLGICNGFQILCESGLLPGVLLRNATLRFACRTVNLRVETSQSLFTRRYRAGEVIAVPVAHGDGNYFADPQTLDRLEQRGLVAFRYCGPDGALAAAHNPNGSARHIAGVLNEAGNVLGLMPHPENATDPVAGGTDGLRLFQALAELVS